MHASNGNVDNVKRGVRRESETTSGTSGRAESRSPRRNKPAEPVIPPQQLDSDFAGIQAAYSGVVGVP
eukprot:6761667-Alexandrium_andersonii.AAC.1